MLLLGPGKNSVSQKIALAKFLFYVCSNEINSPKNSVSQILVIVLKISGNEISGNEISDNEISGNEISIRQELPV